MPLLVIHQGTLILEDRQAAAAIPALEINDVNLKVVNDPPNLVTVDGDGASELFGPVHLHGTWHRDTQGVELTVAVPALTFTPALVQRLACYCPDGHLNGLQLEGRAEIKADFRYRPGNTRPWTYETSCRVRQGKVRHPRLPLPLDELETSLRCADGVLTLVDLKAKSGTAAVQASGTAQLPHPDQDFRGTLTVDHLHMCSELFDKLPEAVRNLHPMFQPAGPAQVRFDGECRGGQWVKNLWTLHPRGASLCYVHFKYPVDNVTGRLAFDQLTNRIEVDLHGMSPERPITLTGTWKDFGKDADVLLDLDARAVPLDEPLFKAMPTPYLEELARSFRATGKAHLQAHFRHAPGAEDFYSTYHAQFYDATLNWKELQYTLDKVSGKLDVFPTHWTIKDCQGSHHGGVIRAWGGSVPRALGEPATAEQRVVIDVTGENIALDADLKHMLEKVPGVTRVWEAFAPAGRVNFGARIDQPPHQPQDLDLALDVRGCQLTPSFFPLALHEVCCFVRYHKNQVLIKNLTASHYRSKLSIDEGVVDLGANGAYRAELKKLIANPVLPDADLAAALPPKLRELWEPLKLTEPFALQTNLVVAQGPESGAPPQIYWDSQLWLYRAKVNLGVEVSEVTGCVACQGLHDGFQIKGVKGNALLERATVFNQPFHDVQLGFQILEKTPDELSLALYAPLFGGDVTGSGHLTMGSRLRYELDLTASQIQLMPFARHNLGPEHQLSGLAAARLHLTGQGDGIATLAGNGSLDVPFSPTTKLYNLPLLLDLLKFLGLRWPDRTAFEEAHATFNIQGNRLTIQRLDMLGSAVSVWGQGGVNLDGTDIKLDIYPSWARLEQVVPLPGPMRTLPSEISKNLLKIEMRGKVGANPDDVQFNRVVVPGIVEPFMQMRDNLFGKEQK
jgi:hypothetical protein